jgi:hypothetical protein
MKRLLAALIGVGLGAAGCGGSESSSGTTSSSMDASVSDASTGAGGSAGSNGAGGSGGGATSEAGIDLDAFPIPDGPIGVCAACIRDTCQQDLSTCASDPKCQMGVICSIQNCAQYAGMGTEAGAAGLQCITQCFGDLLTALNALSGLTCVTTKCDACTSLLDGGFDAGL